MTTTIKILRYLLLVLLIVILGGTVGWYFFVQSKTKASATATGQGLNETTPTFGGSDSGVVPNTAVVNIKPGTDTGPISSNTQSTSALWRVEAAPVAGMGFVSTSSKNSLYYVMRATGYVIQADLSTRSTQRVTNTLMPKIYSAFVSNLGSVILRSISDTGAITTYAATPSLSAATTTGDAALHGIYLPQNISELSINPASQTILYLTRGRING